MASGLLNPTLFFTWNDDSEGHGHAIEPSASYGDAYLEAVGSTFAK